MAYLAFDSHLKRGDFTPSCQMNKESIRKQNIAIRNELDKNQILRMSESITLKLNGIESVRKAERIMSYVSFGKEVYTHSLIRQWLAEKKGVSVPCVYKASKEGRCMYAVSISDFDELTVRSGYGILEPVLCGSKIVAPESIDVVIIPGNAFDVGKNRIGYGAGYYDKFLRETSPKCVKIAICFDFQVLKAVPYDEYDVPVDLIVTEKRIIS